MMNPGIRGAQWRIALLALAAAASAGAQEPAEPPRAFNHSLRGDLSKLGWERLGPRANTSVKYERTGLRFTLPPVPAGEQRNAVSTGIRVQGDFEITVRFEVLQEPAAAEAGAEPRLTLTAVLDKPTNNMATLSRTLLTEGPHFVPWLTLWNEETRRVETTSDVFRTTARTGRLRLVRTGPRVAYEVAEGAAEQFRRLGEYPLGPEDLKDVRFVAQVGRPTGALEVRFTDFHMRAEALTLPAAALTEALRFLLFSPEGDRLASGGAAGTVTLWARAPAPARAPFDQRQGKYWDVAFTPDGRILALGGYSTVELLDVATGQTRRTLEVGKLARALAFSGDGRYLAVGTESLAKGAATEVLLYRAQDGTLLERLEGIGRKIERVQFAPDGKTLASASLAKSIHLWEVPSGKDLGTLTGPGADARDIVFLPSGILVSAGRDGNITFWDLATRQPRNTWNNKLGKALAALAVSPDGTLLATAAAAGKAPGPVLLKVWDVAGGTEKWQLQGHANPILGLAFSPDGRTLLGVGGTKDAFGELSCWDLTTGRLRSTRQTRSNWMLHVALHRDGQLASSVSSDRVHLWDLGWTHPEQTWTAPAGEVSTGIFRERGQGLLVATGVGNTIKLWDSQRGERPEPLQGHAGRVRALAFAPDGKTLASAGEPAELIFWDLATGQRRAALARLDQAVQALAYSPDATLLAGAGVDGTVRIWNARTGQVRATLPAAQALAFAPAGKLLAMATPAGAITFWDTATWQQQAALAEQPGPVSSMAFSPDGRSLAFAGPDGTIELAAVPGLAAPAPDSPPPPAAPVAEAPWRRRLWLVAGLGLFLGLAVAGAWLRQRRSPPRD